MTMKRTFKPPAEAAVTCCVRCGADVLDMTDGAVALLDVPCVDGDGQRHERHVPRDGGNVRVKVF